MTPADQKERDKRHVRSLQNPRIISNFKLCNVTLAEADRSELLGIISHLQGEVDKLMQELARHLPKRKQQPDRTDVRQHSASA